MIQVHKILCNPSVSMGFWLHAKGDWLPRLVPFGQKNLENFHGIHHGKSVMRRLGHLGDTLW